MQQRSQIPEADDKTTINALIKGLTPGPTASHLTRKKPKTIEELFHKLEEYILSDDDHRKRVAERNEARQGNREMTWRAPPQHPRNVNNVGNSNLNKATGQAPGEGSILEEGGEAEDPRHSRTTARKILTSIASIMGGAIAPKGAQKRRRTWQEFSKRKH
jgi:hypothetical protein